MFSVRVGFFLLLLLFHLNETESHSEHDKRFFLHIHRHTRVRHRHRNNFLHVLRSHGVTKQRQIHLTQKWWLLYASEKCVHIKKPKKSPRECENTCERENMENQVKRETNFSFEWFALLPPPPSLCAATAFSLRLSLFFFFSNKYDDMFLLASFYSNTHRHRHRDTDTLMRPSKYSVRLDYASKWLSNKII